MSATSKLARGAQLRPLARLPRGWTVIWLALLAWVLFVLLVLGIWKAAELVGLIIVHA